MLKFASSAAHAYNKKLISCETFTWLGEHFKTAWSQCKPEVDQVFLSGVNHVFYHGTTYSPADAKWPGWLFYASVNFVPNNSMWPHLKGLNEYITRCQSVLQAGKPGESVKVYWPVYDVWHDVKGLDMPFKVHDINEWLHPTAFYKNVTELQKKGYAVDFVSDKMMKERAAYLSLVKRAGHDNYVIPACKFMPVNTLRTIINLARQGDFIVMQSLPKDVPGFGNIDEERSELKKMLDSISFKEMDKNIIGAKIGNGFIVITENVLEGVSIDRDQEGEPMAADGLEFVKRIDGDEAYYFIVNNTGNDIDKRIDFNVSAKKVVIMNPLNGETGGASFVGVPGLTVVWLQLKSGQSTILKFCNKDFIVNTWKYEKRKDEIINLTGSNWQLHFKYGGPKLPADKKMTNMQPWTNFTDDSTTQSFSGTGIYTTTFNLKNTAADYLLQLDKLYESAKVIVNGKDAGLIWSLPYEMKIGKYLKPGKNTISIEICNLMANRIRNMDRNGEVWRNYHEINFVNINYKNFDASDWKVQPSGLGGEIKLIPLK